MRVKSKANRWPANAAGERVVLEARALAAAIPARVLIVPWGRVVSANGSFVMDDAAGRAVLEAFRRHGTDVPVDYEHQSLGGPYASPSGQAPAAGWIRGLDAVRPGGASEPGLYADVEWTESARARLAAREYRYLSPVVIVRKSDRRVLALHSVALTNKPAIVGMKPIVNREEIMTETTMDEAVEQLRLRLDLPAESDLTAVLLAASDRVESLEAESARRAAHERVENALRAGKLTGAQQEWAMSLAMKDPAGFDEWLASAPTVVAVGRTEPPDGNVATGGRNRSAVIASARAAYRNEPGLALLTSEEAWIEEALREAGLESGSAN